MITEQDKKLAREMARMAVCILQGISGGQGRASVGVFDAGAGSGFVNGDLYICLERDGLIVWIRCDD